jgi:predicted Zn-ribbon and HTH transcriptional regulator
MVKYWEFKIFRRIIQRMGMGYSPVVLITGPPNTGKTCLGALLSEVIEFHFKKREWDPETNCFFDMNELSYKLLDAKKTPILIAEAGYELAFDEWQSKYNKFFDKIVTTQRIMGNCYILNIPVAKDLARRQRRKCDFIFDVKWWGMSKCWEMRIKTREMVGNEFKTKYWGEIGGYPVPKCHKKLKQLDEDNKNRIRKELIQGIQEEKMKTIELKELKRTKFRCTCGYEWSPRVKNPRRCPNCQKKIFMSRGNLDVEKIEE